MRGESDLSTVEYMPVPPTALVVDDDPVLLEALPGLFKIRFPDLRVDRCDTVTSALDHLQLQDYGVLITDMRMPAQTGLSFLEHAKLLRPC